MSSMPHDGSNPHATTAKVRTFTLETMTWGKSIPNEASGALAKNTGYEIKLASAGLLHKTKYHANNLTPVELKPKHIDPEFTERGALMLRTVEEGILVTRFRFWRDGGEKSKTSRSFLLARSVLLEGISDARELSVEFLAWCVEEFRVEPFHEDSPVEFAPIEVSMPLLSSAEVGSLVERLLEENWNDTGLCLESLDRPMAENRNFEAALPQNSDSSVVAGAVAQEAENITLKALRVAAEAINGQFTHYMTPPETSVSISIGLSPATKAADLMFSSRVAHQDAFEVDEATSQKIAKYIVTVGSKTEPPSSKPETQMVRDTAGRMIGVESIILRDNV